jgi:ankyrin repeat protein
VNAKSEADATPLHYAARLGQKETVELLIAAGADVNAKFEDGETPLYWASGKIADLLRQHGGKTAKAPDISIHAAARQGKIEAVKQHLTDGVGVNAKSERGRTPLHSAAREGHKEVVELLIANGADVNPKDMKGQTPLDMTNHPEIADLLRKHGGKTGDELKAEGK